MGLFCCISGTTKDRADLLLGDVLQQKVSKTYKTGIGICNTSYSVPVMEDTVNIDENTNTSIGCTRIEYLA